MSEEEMQKMIDSQKEEIKKLTDQMSLNTKEFEEAKKIWDHDRKQLQEDMKKLTSDPKKELTFTDYAKSLMEAIDK